MPNEDGARRKRRRRLDLMTSLRDEIAVRRTIAGEVISLANLLGRPVVDPDDRRVGRVSDVTVHWGRGSSSSTCLRRSRQPEQRIRPRRRVGG